MASFAELDCQEPPLFVASQRRLVFFSQVLMRSNRLKRDIVRVMRTNENYESVVNSQTVARRASPTRRERHHAAADFPGLASPVVSCHAWVLLFEIPLELSDRMVPSVLQLRHEATVPAPAFAHVLCVT